MNSPKRYQRFFGGHMTTRFYVESHEDVGAVFLDRVAADMFPIPGTLIEAAHQIVRIIRHRDPLDEHLVEIPAVGNGLGMSGLLLAFGVSVMLSHGFQDPFPNQDE